MGLDGFYIVFFSFRFPSVSLSFCLRLGFCVSLFTLCDVADRCHRRNERTFTVFGLVQTHKYAKQPGNKCREEWRGTRVTGKNRQNRNNLRQTRRLGPGAYSI